MISKEKKLKFTLTTVLPTNEKQMLVDFENVFLDMIDEKKKPFSKYFIEMPKELESYFLKYVEIKKQKIKSYNSNKNKTIFEF